MRFVHLVNFTTEGAKTIGESKKRYDWFEQGVKAAGGRIIDAYGVLGAHDLVVTTEMPDEKAVIKVVAATVARGTVSVQTLTAIPIKEFYELVDQAVGAAAARR
jgi:uncharacterized protein with GYD domain